MVTCPTGAPNYLTESCKAMPKESKHFLSESENCPSKMIPDLSKLSVGPERGLNPSMASSSLFNFSYNLRSVRRGQRPSTSGKGSVFFREDSQGVPWKGFVFCVGFVCVCVFAIFQGGG